MWLVTDRGFYSVVDKGERADHLCVRGRVREDIDNLFELDSLAAYARDVIETDNSDYRYRVYVKRGDWARAIAGLAERIEYDNFKSEVERVQGSDRAHTYLRVWSALFDLQPRGRALTGPAVNRRLRSRGRPPDPAPADRDRPR